MLPCFTDTSIEEFLSSLYTCIQKDTVQNSYNIFEYKTLQSKNKLYKAIESYKNNQTIFYSKFITDYPEINVKSIKDITMNERVTCKGKGAYPNGTYYLKFTVYYEKKC